MSINFTKSSSTVINLGTPSILNLDPKGEWCIMGWIKPTNIGTLLSKRDTSNHQYQLGITNGGYAFGLCGNGTIRIGTTDIITAGSWHHIALRCYWTGSYYGIKVHVNGVVEAGPFETGTETYSGDVCIGARRSTSSTYGFELSGLLSDVRVYTGYLYPAEVTNIYNLRGSDGIVNNLIGRWPLHEKSKGSTASGAGTVKDYSNYKNHGEPINSPSYSGIQLKFRRNV